jgi:uncharacterized membrane protein (GlpM family)
MIDLCAFARFIEAASYVLVLVGGVCAWVVVTWALVLVNWRLSR